MRRKQVGFTARTQRKSSHLSISHIRASYKFRSVSRHVFPSSAPQPGFGDSCCVSGEREKGAYSGSRGKGFVCGMCQLSIAKLKLVTRNNKRWWHDIWIPRPLLLVPEFLFLKILLCHIVSFDVSSRNKLCCKYVHDDTKTRFVESECMYSNNNNVSLIFHKWWFDRRLDVSSSSSWLLRKV